MRGGDPTRRRVLKAGCLLGAFSTAGCLRLTNSGTQQTTAAADTVAGDDTPTETATPTPETESPTPDTESDSNERYPPGITADGVSGTLALSHQQATEGRSRTVETQYMFERRTTRIGDAGLLVETERGPEVFVSEGRMYQRYLSGSDTYYDYRDEVIRSYRREALAGVDVLRGLIEGCNFAPVGTQTIDNETLVLIEADSVTDSRALADAENIGRYFRESEFPLELDSASGAVTQNGVIRELTAFLEGDGDSGEFLVRTSDIGATTVTTPDWTATARDREPRFESELVDDGQYIRVEQVAGQSIDAELDIDAFDRRAYYDGEFTGSTSSGTVLFLYKTDETNEFDQRRLGIAKGSPPSSSPAGAWSSETGWNLSIGPMELVRGRDP